MSDQSVEKYYNQPCASISQELVDLNVKYHDVTDVIQISSF